MNAPGLMTIENYQYRHPSRGRNCFNIYERAQLALGKPFDTILETWRSMSEEEKLPWQKETTALRLDRDRNSARMAFGSATSRKGVPKGYVASIPVVEVVHHAPDTANLSSSRSLPTADASKATMKDADEQRLAFPEPYNFMAAIDKQPDSIQGQGHARLRCKHWDSIKAKYVKWQEGYEAADLPSVPDFNVLDKMMNFAQGVCVECKEAEEAAGLQHLQLSSTCQYKLGTCSVFASFSEDYANSLMQWTKRRWMKPNLRL